MSININIEMNDLMDILYDQKIGPLKKNYATTKWLTDLQRKVATEEVFFTPRYKIEEKTETSWLPWGGTDIDLGGS